MQSEFSALNYYRINIDVPIAFEGSNWLSLIGLFISKVTNKSGPWKFEVEKNKRAGPNKSVQVGNLRWKK